MKPLGPVSFLIRNPGKSLPVVAVIAMAVALIAGIVALMDSIPLSIRTIYGYSRHYTGVTPRGDAELTPVLKQAIESEAPVELARVIVTRAASSEVSSMVGPWPFVVLGLNPDDMQFYLDRMGVKSVQGRAPAPGEAAAIVSEPVARNLNLQIGDSLLGPEIADSYSPEPVEVVGIAKTDQWLILAPYDYIAENHFPPVNLLLAFASNPDRQEQLDRWAVKTLEERGARVFAYYRLDDETDAMFATLYRILDIVIALLVVLITAMMAMLVNIFHAQRAQETGLLQAIGYTRRFLVRRALAEAAILVMAGWLCGVGLAMGLLLIVKERLFEPNAYALDPTPMMALVYTLPMPIAIFLALFVTVFARLKRHDPIGVVERRLA